MVDCKGHVAWISSDGASVVNAPQYVTLTADANIRSGADTTYAILGVGTAGSTYEYLNETQNTKWLKVNYNGQTGWISNVNATLGAAPTIVNVTAANQDWAVEEEPLEIAVSTVNGAQIRTSGSQGLRFISSIDKSDVDFSRVVEYGTLLIPSADITDISQLQIGATLNGHAVAKVAAKTIYNETDTSVTFTAVIIDIADKNLKREYTARAYAIFDDGTIAYASTGASRSVYGVATAGLAAGKESESVLKVFQDIIDRADKYGDNDVVWPW
jgi:SH3-like domain-containing protein